MRHKTWRMLMGHRSTPVGFVGYYHSWFCRYQLSKYQSLQILSPNPNQCSSKALWTSLSDLLNRFWVGIEDAWYRWQTPTSWALHISERFLWVGTNLEWKSKRLERRRCRFACSLVPISLERRKQNPSQTQVQIATLERIGWRKACLSTL